MKQGKIYTKLILGLLLSAVVAYMGFALLRTLEAPLSTVRAIEYEAGTTCRVTGFVVRDETVLTSPYGITVLTRREGERVGVGQPVATGYQSAGAQARQMEIEAMEAELAQLRYAWSDDPDLDNTAALDQELTSLIAEAARGAVQHDLAAAEALGPRIKGLLLRRDASPDKLEALGAQIEALDAELAALRSGSGAGVRTVTAPASGCFSSGADGYEQVLTPDRLSTLTLSELRTLSPAALPNGACGRLVRSGDWYFVCAVPAGLVDELEPGDTVTVGISHGPSGTMEMRITRIGDEENGERLLVLSNDDYIQDVTLLRQHTTELIFHSYSGLRVPKTALVMDGSDRPSVYILEGGRSKSKAVSILYDNGESYVVALDKSDTGNLWPGDEIILNPRNLYDGKVVIES